MSDEELLALVTPRNAVEAAHPLAMHGRAARRLAEEWGVTDPAVLRAVEGHVFGVEAGDRVGAALYVADVSEPGRGVNEELRDLALRDLWAAYARAVATKVEYLRGCGRELLHDALRAYESLRERAARQAYARDSPGRPRGAGRPGRLVADPRRPARRARRRPTSPPRPRRGRVPCQLRRGRPQPRNRLRPL